jgi:hypothetical protein
MGFAIGSRWRAGKELKLVALPFAFEVSVGGSCGADQFWRTGFDESRGESHRRRLSENTGRSEEKRRESSQWFTDRETHGIQDSRV